MTVVSLMKIYIGYVENDIDTGKYRAESQNVLYIDGENVLLWL